MKQRLSIIGLFVVGLIATLGIYLGVPHSNQVVAQTPNPTTTQTTQLNEIDRQFIMEANQAAIGNIMLGQLALKKSNNSQVQAFANAEIQEQTQNQNNLNKITPQLGVDLSRTPTAKFQAAMARLSQLNEEQFNSAYMDEGGVNAHLENAALFQREAAFGQNPQIVALANSSLPIIKQHFTTASNATNYQFAEVLRQYSNISSNSVTK
ncbi:DUF4142 domain-containing protein [Gloeothece verrucosa]|uniref:DUF4142 domain-containing protein n=1 Tax=Gloeothece verrucosa (strain PCC 7822) TaxID=497965 RepID=E0ULA1_GLOV7|nr:DUF4142 domain-containing protein [Gloeothece verrucosa]ADN17731.1 hypothetical protein Cyan7822_5877 [Gloeothece verrucosa PCC 7822]